MIVSSRPFPVRSLHLKAKVKPGPKQRKAVRLLQRGLGAPVRTAYLPVCDLAPSMIVEKTLDDALLARRSSCTQARRLLVFGRRICQGEWKPLKMKVAKLRSDGTKLWWRIAHTIAQLGHPFIEADLSAACGTELEKFGEDWLRFRLTRACESKPPFSCFPLPAPTGGPALIPRRSSNERLLCRARRAALPRSRPLRPSQSGALDVLTEAREFAPIRGGRFALLHSSISRRIPT